MAVKVVGEGAISVDPFLKWMKKGEKDRRRSGQALVSGKFRKEDIPSDFTTLPPEMQKAVQRMVGSLSVGWLRSLGGGMDKRGVDEDAAAQDRCSEGEGAGAEREWRWQPARLREGCGCRINWPNEQQDKQYTQMSTPKPYIYFSDIIFMGGNAPSWDLRRLPHCSDGRIMLWGVGHDRSCNSCTKYYHSQCKLFRRFCSFQCRIPQTHSQIKSSLEIG